MPYLSHRPTLWLALLLSVAALSPLPADEGARDPEFEKVPFAEWFSHGPQTPLKWSERVLPVILSVHQRLLARVQIQLDGAEGAKRRGEGELIFYFQLTDASGRVYQDHTTYDLEKVEAGLKAQDVVCTESAFVLPGDYTVSVAIYDTATKEHAVKKDKLHVAPLKIEILPDAWRDLPAVEYIEPSESPDHWFLPKELGSLHLPLTARRPLRVEVLANLTPSELTGPSYGLQDRNLKLSLSGSLKVISQIRTPPNVSMDVSLLDLSRRRTVFHQDHVHELDWEKIKSSLSDATSASIDVKSLADRRHNAAFLVSEVTRRNTPAEAATRAVIVLSGPMVFDAEQDLQGIELKPSPDTRVFYIRLQIAAGQRQFVPGPGRRRGIGFPPRATMRDRTSKRPAGRASTSSSPC